MKQYKYPRFYFQILFLLVIFQGGLLFSQHLFGDRIQATRHFTDVEITMVSITDSVVTEDSQRFNAARIGDVVRYNMSVKNLTELDADSVVITQILPPDVTFIAGSFDPSSVQDNLLSWTLDELKGTSSQEWDVSVILNASIPQDVDELVCFVSLICSNDSVATNNSATDIVKVLRPNYDALDVGIEISVQTDTVVDRGGNRYAAVYENDPFQYSIRLFNAGPLEVENIQVVHELPENVISPSQQPAAHNEMGRTLVWLFPRLGIGADTTITVDATAAYVDEKVTLSTVRASAVHEAAHDNNSDSVAVWVLDQKMPLPTNCDVELTYKVLADSSIQIGDSLYKAVRYFESFAYHIDVHNNGPATAQDIRVQNTLPDGIGANLFNLMPDDSTENGLTWTIDSLAVGESWSVSILVVAGRAITEYPHRAVSSATISAANDTLAANNHKEAIVYILGDPILPVDLSIHQSIEADSSERVDAKTFPVITQNEYYRISIDLANWSQTDAENVVLLYIVDDSLSILGTSPTSDVFTPDSVVWYFDSVLANTTSRFIVDVQVASVMPDARNLLSNVLRVSADNENANRTGNNHSVLTMVNYGVPAEPFEPSMIISPENASVSDSIRIRVSFPVEIVTWDLWVYLPSGEIVKNFADHFIRNTDIQPGEWYDIDVPFVHSTLMDDTDADELIFELHATGLYGIHATLRKSILVVPGFDVLPPNVVSPGSTEIPIDFVVPFGHVEIKLFDISGRHIVDLVDEEYPSGRHTLMWNGQTANGQMVGSGVYLVTLRTKQANTFKKMIIVR